MRDPKRIDKFCWRLAEAWKKAPDWRFGQLMVNCLCSMDTDPFFPKVAGIPVETIRDRVRHGWSVERAATENVHRR